MAVPVRDDYSAEDLRKLAAQRIDSNQARRLLAIAMVLDGASRAEAARCGGMDRQTLRDWVHRFNDQGPDGLVNRKSAGPKSRLDADQRAQLKEIVLTGPDLEKDGIVRWRRIDLKEVVKKRFGVDYNERTIGKILKSLNLSYVSARPQHPRSDPEAQEAFKQTSNPRS